MAVVRKCTTVRRSVFCFIEVSFDDKPDRRNLLRNVSTFPVFKEGLFTRCSPSLAGNSILRYPAHPFGYGRCKFPRIGEFQCYDKYMMGDLKMAARKEGKHQWEEKGPQKAGCYKSLPSEVPFFGEGEESLLSDYGCFFLEWYSGRLLHHADDILAKAANILKKYQENKQTSIILAAKIGGIYWWYQGIAHPAKLTPGYYNTAVRDGYDPVASPLYCHGAALHVP
ncbi:inactive beta-amylase 4, chloroplastic-like [Malus domestica]|uniref:inactive beta-amylase 4, chloroplastic-like n=1 Tax=Malus domestica TaxID=3750 RepID=UPI003974C85E